MAAPKVDHGFACSSVPFLKTRYRETVIRTYNPTNNYSCYRIYRVSCLSCLNVFYHITYQTYLLVANSEALLSKFRLSSIPP